MKITNAHLFKINLPLLSPVKTSYGQLTTKDFILLELTNDSGLKGYGECCAFSIPFYTEEFRDGAYSLLKEQLIPALLRQELKQAEDVWQLYQGIKRNNMAKSAVDNAVWDLFAQEQKQSLAHLLGGNKTEIEAGISLGIQSSPQRLVALVQKALDKGYRRIKIKIMPKRDYKYIAAVRDKFPNIMLMADANCAYSLKDIDFFKSLDKFKLLMIEQPLEPGDLIHHAKLQAKISTPICLDESINSLSDAKAMLELGSGKIINIKVSKVGGLTQAKAIQKFALDNDLPCWCGGMYSSGVARAVDLAAASLPGYTLPNDISASSHYFKHDIIFPEINLKNGKLQVPTGNGIGVKLNWQIVNKYTIKEDKVY